MSHQITLFIGNLNFSLVAYKKRVKKLRFLH